MLDVNNLFGLSSHISSFGKPHVKEQAMGRNNEWDDAEADWHKAAIYPKRYEGRAMRNLSAAAIERDDKLNALLDQEFGIGMYIPSPKNFSAG